MWCTEYIRALEPFDVGTLSHAVNDLVKTYRSAQFPKPAHIVAACDAIEGKRVVATEPRALADSSDLHNGKPPSFWVRCHKYVRQKEQVVDGDYWIPKTTANSRRWLREHPEFAAAAKDEGWLDTHLMPWLNDAYRAVRTKHFKDHDGKPPGDPPWANFAEPSELVPAWRAQKEAWRQALSAKTPGAKQVGDAAQQSPTGA